MKEIKVWTKNILVAAIIVTATYAISIFVGNLVNLDVDCEPTMKLSKVCESYMPTNVGQTYAHMQLVKGLNSLNERDEITIYLVGHGGISESGRMIANAMIHSKAHVKVVVMGDIYSAHALIAAAADELIIHGSTTVMFHRSSSFKNTRCGGVEGIDRGIEKSIKCEQMMNADMKADIKIANLLIKPILTKEQWNNYLKGWDIYISGDEMKFKFDLKHK